MPDIPDYNASILQNRIIVNQSNVVSTLGGAIDGSKEYFIDGIIDLSGLSISIEVPAEGIQIRGYSFNVSKLICSDNSYTLFNSPIGGSGDILGMDFAIEITGTSSKVCDIKSLDGTQAIEWNSINWNNLTEFGTIDNYAQGLETGTGRFGGSPSLTLKGAWSGGYFITTSIVRGVSDITTEPLFKKGTAFVMQSRFRSNMNVDLGTLMPYIDFESSNFPNPSTFQLKDGIITRDGLSNAIDANITPNIDAGDLASNWKGNNGMENTFEGGSATVTVEVATTINTTGVFEILLGTWSVTNLQHFDSPGNGQLRHLGDNPREYIIVVDLGLVSTANNALSVRVRRFDFSTTTFVTEFTQSRQVNNLLGARDLAFFNINTPIVLDKNDYVFLEITNDTATNDVTAEASSFYNLRER